MFQFSSDYVWSRNLQTDGLPATRPHQTHTRSMLGAATLRKRHHPHYAWSRGTPAISGPCTTVVISGNQGHIDYSSLITSFAFLKFFFSSLESPNKSLYKQGFAFKISDFLICFFFIFYLHVLHVFEKLNKRHTSSVLNNIIKEKLKELANANPTNLLRFILFHEKLNIKQIEVITTFFKSVYKKCQRYSKFT